MIGLREQQGELQRAIEEARSSRGSTLLVCGELGTGKTVLVEEIIGRSELTLLGAQAAAAGAPYGSITGLLRSWMRRSDSDAHRFGPLAHCLLTLLPELAPELRGSETPCDPDTFTEAVTSALLATAGDAPAALFIDDAHHADAATLELLARLDDRAATERLLVVLAYRPEEVSARHPLRALRDTLRRRRRLTQIELPRLTEDEVHELCRQICNEAPGRPFSRFVFERSEGVALFAEELARSLDERNARPASEPSGEAPWQSASIPDGVQDAVAQRLSQLSEQAAQLAEIAAIVGTEFELADLYAISGQRPGTPDETEEDKRATGWHETDQLFDAGIFVERAPGRAAFRLAITADAIRNALPWSRRRALAHAAARYFEQRGAEPQLVARLWLDANQPDPARKALMRSVSHSCSLYAYRDAVSAARRALDLWPENGSDEERVELVRQLAHCAQLTGQLAEAERSLQELAEALSRSDALRSQAEVQRSLATVYSLQGKWLNARAARQRAQELFVGCGELHEAAAEAIAAASELLGGLRLQDALDAVRRAIQYAQHADRIDLSVRAQGLEGYLLAMLGESAAGREKAQAALTLALNHNMGELASEAYQRLGNVLEYTSDYEEAAEMYDTAVDMCRRHDAEVTAQTCLGCMSYVLFRMGEWNRAATMSRSLLTSESASTTSRGAANATLGLIHALKSEPRRARPVIDEASKLAEAENDLILGIIVRWADALQSEQSGDRDLAAERYRELLELWRRTEDRHDVLPALCSAVSMFASAGLERDITTCVEALSTIAAVTGNQEALAALGYALGESACARKRFEEAVEQLSAAADHFRHLRLPLEHARCRSRLGTALAASGKRPDGLAAMRNAYRSARRLGAAALAAAIAGELSSLGEPVEERRNAESTERASRHGLTGRQVEIVRLIGEGLTTRRIAERLYLSPRTVEMHVANLLDRLDCESRSEAVRKAATLGLLEQ